jgi:hypothetical protein
VADLTITRGARLAAIGLLILTLLTGAGNLWASLDLTRGVQQDAASSCRFFADLAGLPVAVTPATGKAALLGVEIVADSRLAWRGLGCPGALPAPAPSFILWARYYRLPYR